MRAMRVDKITLAALGATLRLYRDPQSAERSLPLLTLLSTPLANLKNRAERLAPQLAATQAVAAAEPLKAPRFSAAERFPRRKSRPGASP